MNNHIRTREDDLLKEILLKQLQLLQEVCERNMTPDAEAELSNRLASALSYGMGLLPIAKLNG